MAVQGADATKLLKTLVRDIRACRLCVDRPRGRPLPHAPRPVLQVSATARLAICGQAPGVRVHASGRPFTDPSGDRLRAWTALAPHVFYDVDQVAIVPTGFCFPGLDAAGSDLPPRPECAETWHRRLFALLPAVDLVLLVGGYAQRWHLGRAGAGSVTATVADWRRILSEPRDGRLYLPLPHPSWRNNAWIVNNPWFERDLLPEARRLVHARVAAPAPARHSLAT